MITDERVAVLSAFGVSRETADRLDLYVAQLQRWQPIINLVGSSTLQHVWSRHIADSLQLLDLESTALRWLDLGSGAGFPGLVLAIANAKRPDFSVTLVESNARKCAFLRETARLTQAAASVRNVRIEKAMEGEIGTDVVCARGLASLTKLLHWTEPLLKTGTIGLFLKGRDASLELTEAARRWTFASDLLPSRTGPESGIIRVRNLSPRFS